MLHRQLNRISRVWFERLDPKKFSAISSKEEKKFGIPRTNEMSALPFYFDTQKSILDFQNKFGGNRYFSILLIELFWVTFVV